jgi:hypothetical protein
VRQVGFIYKTVNLLFFFNFYKVLPDVDSLYRNMKHWLIILKCCVWWSYFIWTQHNTTGWTRMKHLWMSPFPYVHKIYSPHWVAIFSVFNNPVPASWGALLFMPGDRIARVTTVLTAIGDATPTAAQQTLCWGSTKRRTQHSNMWCCFTSSYFEPFASYLLT